MAGPCGSPRCQPHPSRCPESRVCFGPFGYEAFTDGEQSPYDAGRVCSRLDGEIAELRVSRYSADAYRLKAIEIRYRGDAGFATAFGAPGLGGASRTGDRDTTEVTSSLRLDAGEVFVELWLGFYLGQLSGFEAHTNRRRCVVARCDRLERGGLVDTCVVHNAGARLLGLAGSCGDPFICSLSVVFDNSWASLRGDLVRLRELCRLCRAEPIRRRVPPQVDDDDDDDDNGAWLCHVLPALFALPDAVQRHIITHL